MNAIARNLLGAVAAAVARKLLPDACIEKDTVSKKLHALALRSDAALAPLDRSDFFPTARPLQTLYVPPPAPVQPVAAPAAPSRRRRKVVTETLYYEEREW